MKIAANYLLNLCNDAMYKDQGCVDWDMESYCWQNGHWRWDDTVDPDGNIVDSIRIIATQDVQEACDDLGLNIDCLNF